ncbi:MAG: fluoride efflux transporter CrcB [Chlamydiia bacterium]|jgi:CrcB protein
MVYAFMSIGIGATLGAWLRWWFGLTMNSIFPTIPLGTLTANILGGFLMGLFMALTRNHAFIPETARLAIMTGFLGGLTTFSTFSAETVTLLSNQEYLWTAVIIIGHVVGSILATIFGIYVFKFFTF